MALIEIDDFPSNRNLHLFLGFSMAMLNNQMVKRKILGWMSLHCIHVHHELAKTKNPNRDFLRGYPKSSMLVGFSLINNPAIGVPTIYGNLQIVELLRDVSFSRFSPGCPWIWGSKSLQQRSSSAGDAGTHTSSANTTGWGPPVISWLNHDTTPMNTSSLYLS